MNDIASASGRALYHAIWAKVQERFFDPARLDALDWQSFAHRFDEKIVDDASALECAEIMLAALGEKYTKLLRADEVKAKREGRVNDSLYAYNNIMTSASDSFKIGYIGISSFDHSEIADQVAERLEGIAHCDAFVVDVRGNGGGLLDETANTLELFIDEGDICFIERRTTRGVAENFVYFSSEHFIRYTEATGKEPDKGLYLRRQPLIAGKPMVVLVDGDTASSAELFSAALLHNGRENSSVVCMGVPTTGKGIGQADFDIAPGVTLKVSCIRFFSPIQEWFGDAGQTVANGVKPDIEFVGVSDDGRDKDGRCAVDEACDYLRAMLRAR